MTRQTASAVAKERPRSTATLLYGISTGVIITLFVFMRLWRLTDVSLDGDEIFSLLLVRSDWRTLFAGAVHDAIHPPFFYVLLKAWVWLGGESLFWLRLFPVVASTLCLAPAFLLCTDLGISRGARNLAVFIASVHPYAIYFAQHMRMYCLLALFGLTSIWSFERYLKDGSRRSLVILSAANLLLVYSHYYGWLIIGLEFFYLLWKKRNALLPLIVSSTSVAVLFSPWAWLAAQSLHAKGGLAENLGWVPRPDFSYLSWFYVELCGLGEALRFGERITVAIFAFLYFMYRRREEPGFHWLAVVSLTPALIAYVVSQWLSQSIWGSRHLIFTLWPFLLVFADMIWHLHALVRALALALILAWAGYAVQSYSPEQQKIHWDRLTLAMLDAENGNVSHIPLYAVDPYLHYPIWFHLESLKDQRLKQLGPYVNSRNDIAMLRRTAAKFEVNKITTLDAAQGDYFWIGYIDSAWRGPLTPKEIFEKRGCITELELNAKDRFQSVTLFRVQCSQKIP
jgi:hypothetical protein